MPLLLIASYESEIVAIAAVKACDGTNELVSINLE